MFIRDRQQNDNNTNLNYNVLGDAGPSSDCSGVCTVVVLSKESSYIMNNPTSSTSSLGSSGLLCSHTNNLHSSELLDLFRLRSDRLCNKTIITDIMDMFCQSKLMTLF